MAPPHKLIAQGKDHAERARALRAQGVEKDAIAARLGLSRTRVNVLLRVKKK